MTKAQLFATEFDLTHPDGAVEMVVVIRFDDGSVFINGPTELMKLGVAVREPNSDEACEVYEDFTIDDSSEDEPQAPPWIWGTSPDGVC